MSQQVYIIECQALNIKREFDNKADAQAFSEQLAKDHPNATILRFITDKPNHEQPHSAQNNSTPARQLVNLMDWQDDRLIETADFIGDLVFYSEQVDRIKQLAQIAQILGGDGSDNSLTKQRTRAVFDVIDEMLDRLADYLYSDADKLNQKFKGTKWHRTKP